ncbi:hypothetical protein KIN20_008029 [Parelaphostrongylus tenuis]|uniref:Poly [ADP-ribose] polymerase n=1 Tax=Parelaphostrongylus tenuis TaxID=148309 RepID=A0AAD5QIF1_PARTN|nr:hypothetical protein KIN20_008029 [Parelaphostrongylus tenuis]
MMELSDLVTAVRHHVLDRRDGVNKQANKVVDDARMAAGSMQRFQVNASICLENITSSIVYDTPFKVLLDAISSLEASGIDSAAIKPEKSLINARNKRGYTALCLAVEHQSLDSVKALLMHKSVLVDYPTSTARNKLTPLMIACGLGDLSIAECLIEHGALIEAKDTKKRTALCHSVLNGQEHCAAMLLARGADMLKGDSSGNTPAHYAAAYGWLECLQLLSSIEPSCLKQENDWKLTPLSVAYLKGHYGIVRWLLEEKANLVDINGKDMEGVTLLSSLLRYAGQENYSELAEQMQYLLSRGADCSLADSMGNSIVHVFAGMEFRIRDENNGATEGLTENEYRKCFEAIMNHGGDVKSKNESGQTPLHIALESGNLLIFKWMLDYVEDVREVLRTPWSPDFTLLHALLELPMKVFRKENLWFKNSPPFLQLYDVMSFINNVLLKYCDDLVKTWLRQADSDGLQPLLKAARAYSFLSKPQNCDIAAIQNFTDYVSDLIIWGCQLCPDCLTMTSLPRKSDENGTVDKSTTSLAYLALGIRLEGGSLQLLKKIIRISIENNMLKDVLAAEHDGSNLVISALKQNRQAARLILRTTKEHGCVDGVHNVVLRYEISSGSQNYNLDEKLPNEKPINKSLAMLLTEQKLFDLVYELYLSANEWKHEDANGDNLWHYAARTQDLRAVDLFRFIETQGVQNKGNLQGSTPLHEAVQTCECTANSVLEPIEWLAANTSEIPHDVYERTPLHYAFAPREQFMKSSLAEELRDPIAVVSILTRNMNKEQIDCADCDGNTALHLSAFKDANISAVTLIRKGANVSVKNKEGNSPLAVAVLYGRRSVALTLIQANSTFSDKVFSPQKVEEKTLWKWSGSEWEAMVYVLLDALGTSTTSVVQLIDAALKERQYNLANQLTKSLQARMMGKKVENSGYDLVLTFAEYFQGELISNSVEETVLHRLYSLGWEMMYDYVSLPVEAAILHGSWSLYNHFKSRASTSWLSLRPSQPYMGPLRNAVIRLLEQSDTYSEAIVRELAAMPNFSLNEPLALPLPYELTEVSVSRLPPISWACAQGQVQLLDKLRAAGADVNALDSEGRTPLMIAVLANHDRIVEALCTDGSPPVKDSKISNKLNKTARTKANRMLFGSLNGRKRKASDSEDVEEEDDPETNGNESSGGSDDESQSERSTDAEPMDVQPSESARTIKITNNKLELMSCDRNGRNIIHYMVTPFHWENVKLFDKLHVAAPTKIKQLVQQRDKNGNTPMDIAINTKQRTMAAAMKRILNRGNLAKKAAVFNGVHVADLPDVSDLVCSYDVNGDSKSFIARWQAEHEVIDTTSMRKPSSLSGYRDTAELVQFPNTHQYMAAVLNKTDLNYGRYGFHNFYRIELMKRRDTDLWILFTNWGRIGYGCGEYQTTPFSTFEAALKEFKSVWRSKTGQEWAPFDQFQVLPKKYRLLETTKRVENLREISLPWTTTLEKDLTRKTIQDISNPRILKDYARTVDSSMVCPLGHVTEAAIQRAHAVLDECEKNAEDLKKLLDKEGHDDADVLKMYERCRELSSEFYYNLPIGHFEYGSMKIFDDIDAVNFARKTLNRMTEIEVATRLLTASAYRSDVDRISYIAESLECRFTEMSPSDHMSQKILRFIHVTGGESWKVEGILALAPRKATLNFGRFSDDDNQIYLWHGTKAVNLLSILKDGLLADPQNAQTCGRLFGDGVYLADSFEKSSHYCRPSADGLNYMLLCRAALGRCYRVDSANPDWPDAMPNSYDSMHVLGRKYPKSSITVDGVMMPAYGFANHSNRSHRGFLEFSEYVVANSERILPQYLVIYR